LSQVISLLDIPARARFAAYQGAPANKCLADQRPPARKT
jgi:hypothetical protein